MFQEFLTHPLFLASAASFFLGSFGYVLVRLWFSPIIRYRQTTRRIQIELNQFDVTNSGNGEKNGHSKKLRQHADTLTAIYYDDLPYWYRLLLERRQEDPIEAASLLMKLANTASPEHARQQREKIKTYLKIR